MSIVNCVANPYPRYRPRFSQDRVLSVQSVQYLCLRELNCFTVDPNKDRREAVKRKTTQYLKRAEEIFITHLQDNLGKGSSHLGVRQLGYYHLQKVKKKSVW